jgi:hypothetical protein
LFACFIHNENYVREIAQVSNLASAWSRATIYRHLAEEYIAAVCVEGIDVEVWPSRLMTSVLGSVNPETVAFVDREA